MLRLNPEEVKHLFKFFAYISDQLFADEIKSYTNDKDLLLEGPGDLSAMMRLPGGVAAVELTAHDLAASLHEEEVEAPKADLPFEGFEQRSLEENVRRLMALGKWRSGLPSTAQEALDVLTCGLDLKAVLPSGVLGPLELRDLSLQGVDTSTLYWDSVKAINCDFSRGVLYKSVMKNCQFKNCNFSHCVLKGVEVRDGTFENCLFDFSSCGLTVAPTRQCTFSKCSFDLCDFDGFQWNNSKNCFNNCYNLDYGGVVQ
ncbi:Pentapeptide repeats (9 copies)/Pentapeptide repeats (8 copies), putative [Angomonas deanei]|uniref:Pentapeptide repeats (9 copies)/Pentapeptide repeats (8 copies), putative n=1 Tax=Angomonas deanei TaxID=59799 RepID=A0A7G2CAT4_9TRYP|nr:Pentapeptide repeats (9 copies)/Pentapeptide repeats (8 copies), putative [Angomonas deanei]